jgi:predicted esterase
VVHHVAFRVADARAQLAIRRRVAETGGSPGEVIDRHYFRSVYFVEPGGVLFELATDGPGFTIDEPEARLGERLMLPPRFEPDRARIEARLPTIHLPGPTTGQAFAAALGRETRGNVLGFEHRYLEPDGDGALGTTLLLLHGTGGDENDLLPLGRMLLPGAGILSPRGKVLERGMPRFFRRLSEGVFDLEDLARRTEELAEFVEQAGRVYQFALDRVVAVGFSNGANIAGSMLLARPGLIKRAVLLSPMVPFEPEERPDLSGTRVFIGAGRSDPIALPSEAERLAAILESAGAEVTVHWTTGGHGITETEIAAARAWLAG